MTSSVRHIKHAQKESLFLRHIALFFTQIMRDDARIKDIFINRVSLSPDKSICTIYFYSVQGEEYFNQQLEILKLYKPALRSALAQKIKSRYTPDLRFKFDHHFEKQEKIDRLLDSFKEGNDDN